MTKINYQALREAAEKATPGNWWIDSHGQAMVSFIDNEVLEVFVTDNKRDAVRHEDTGNLSRWRNDNDATFIATANPATVLALLDERERNQQYIKRRDQENEDIALTVGKLRVELEAADNNLIDSECHVAELEEALRDKQALLEASEQRIAELESLAAPKLTQQVLVVPDEMPEPDTARMFFTDAVVAIAKVQGWNACRAAMLQCADGSLAHEGKNHPDDKLGMVDHFGGSNNMVEPVTDNTNQQFESLSRGDK